MKKSKEEKSTPKRCVCGKPAITVQSKSMRMLTCPDPVNCLRNLRTAWYRSGGADNMITEWNNLVDQEIYADWRKLRK